MSIRVIWTEEKKAKAIEKLTEYFEKYGIGETIMQGDNAIIEAPEVHKLHTSYPKTKT